MLKTDLVQFSLLYFCCFANSAPVMTKILSGRKRHFVIQKIDMMFGEFCHGNLVPGRFCHVEDSVRGDYVQGSLCQCDCTGRFGAGAVITYAQGVYVRGRLCAGVSSIVNGTRVTDN